jgi:hypothetical protein
MVELHISLMLKPYIGCMTSVPPYHFYDYRRDNPDFVTHILSYKARRAEALRRIGSTVSRDKRRLLIRQFLSDSNFKLLYFFESAQAKGLLSQFLPAQMQHVADSLPANRHYFEAVYPVNLRSGEGMRRRTTYSFGPGKHALQRMVRDLLQELFPLPSERHFTVKGGVRAALQAVEGHVKLGFMFAIERDIAQFYPSVNVVELATLLRPLPFSVVMNVLAYLPGFVWSGSNHSPDAVHDAPLPLGGLLAQGSAASPIAAEILMADLLRGMPDNVRVVSYADNVLILGETLDSVTAANTALNMLVNEHSCGPLRLKPSDDFRNIPLNGLTFLGNDGEWIEGTIEWRPKRAVLEAVMERIENTSSEPSEIDATIRWLRNWRRGYPRWHDGDSEVALYIAQLGARLAFHAPQRLSRRYNTGVRIVVDYCRDVHAATGEFPDLSMLLPDHHDVLEKNGVRPQFIATIERRLGIRPE